MSSTPRKALEQWLATIDVEADKVIDFGGAQLPVKGRTKSWNVREYDIADLPKPHTEKASPNVLIDLNLPSNNSASLNKYDVAFCLEVMEYMWWPVMALVNIYAVLKPGGKLYISFPFIYPLHEPSSEDVLRYTEVGASKMLRMAKFEIVEMVPRLADYGNVLLDFYAMEGMRPSKTYDMHQATGFLFTVKKPA